MPRTLLAAAVVAAAACACAASAEPVHFKNPAPGEPGHADWVALRFLDITKPASQQTPLPEGSEVMGTFEFFLHETFDPFADPQGVVGGFIDVGFGGRIAVDISGFVLLHPGDLVGPGGIIPNGVGGSVFTDFFNDSILVGSNLNVPLGEHFLGVRFATNSEGLTFTDFHFGFIGFNLFERADGTHGRLYATQWGYETELDTAITIVPTPGAVFALLAAGGLFAGRKRRG